MRNTVRSLWLRLGGAGLAVVFSIIGATSLSATPKQRLSSEAQKRRLDALVRAYPDFLAGHDRIGLEWKDGTRMPVFDGKQRKSYEERLRSASLTDQLLLSYPKGRLAKPPGRQSDPGRFRNTAFFDKMYGDCTKGETQRTLVKVKWLERLNGGAVMMTSVNGVAQRLREVSAELEKMPGLKRFLVPSAGTFNCRPVKDTGQRSMHAWGAAIDINTRYVDYWLWGKRKRYRNRIPWRIVKAFERHGFIWGGKWGHFDTMHFEYRPELLRF